MSAKALVDNYRGSCIYRLMYNGSVLGLRAKVYQNMGYSYYDFNIKYVESSDAPDLVAFLNRYKNSFEKVELVCKDDNYYTQDELDGRVKVTEFKNSADAVKILTPFRWLYKDSEEGV